MLPKAPYINDTRTSPRVRLHPVPVTAVTLGDGFWKPRLTTNREVSVPHLFDMLKEHGVLRNFQRISGEARVGREGALFTDSDLYKWIEAAAWALATGDSPLIRKQIDEAIGVIGPAQQPDGYLNTFHEKPEDRWTNIGSNHELYCAGHLFQAAVAVKRVLGDDRLLKISCKFADYIGTVFGPGKRGDWPGHPEIELALIELYRETGDERYLDLGKFFLDAMQFSERRDMWGHAVRMGYFASGGADYYLESGDLDYEVALRSLWKSLVQRKLYITGASASRYEGEAFGGDFELPNARAYAESCAGISNLFWAWRLLQAWPEAEYADLFERVAYNHLLASISLDGERYFYMNPLSCTGQGELGMWYPWADRGPYERTAWHSCTCCPPNIQRVIAELPGYMFSTSEKGLWAHFYDECALDWQLESGARIGLVQHTNYPWEGSVGFELSLDEEAEFSIFLRIPAWADSAWVQVNDEAPRFAKPGAYFELRRTWSDGDSVLLQLPVEPTFWEADVRVTEDREQVALMRGPVLYCLEGPDNPGLDLASARVDVEITPAEINSAPELGEAVALVMEGTLVADPEGDRPLYFRSGRASSEKPIELVAIPYYAWNNRGPAQMTVWMAKL